MSLRIFCNKFTQLYVAELSVGKFENVYMYLVELRYSLDKQAKKQKQWSVFCLLLCTSGQYLKIPELSHKTWAFIY
jgi:hypothetical protein